MKKDYGRIESCPQKYNQAHFTENHLNGHTQGNNAVSDQGPDVQLVIEINTNSTEFIISNPCMACITRLSKAHMQTG